jgi:hypothetical protein
VPTVVIPTIVSSTVKELDWLNSIVQRHCDGSAGRHRHGRSRQKRSSQDQRCCEYDVFHWNLR